MDYLINELNKCDTTYEFDKIYNLIKKLIDSNVTIKQIDEACLKLPAYKIIDYLMLYGSNDINNLNAIKNYYTSLKINQNKCLVIADSHIGRLDKNENINSKFHNNERGLYMAYNHALKNNINNVIHLGDLLEGDSEKTQYRLNTSNQFEYLKNIYPSINNIKTYLLYGNHDYNLIYFNGANDKFYKICNNMELIGINYSYINFCNYIIKLSHESKLSESFRNIDLPYNFELSGHSHYFNINNKLRLVNIPSLASVSLDQDSIGYIEMINEENEFLFKFFDQNGNYINSKEKILSKIF